MNESNKKYTPTPKVQEILERMGMDDYFAEVLATYSPYDKPCKVHGKALRLRLIDEMGEHWGEGCVDCIRDLIKELDNIENSKETK